MIKLVKPKKEHEEKVLEFLEEFISERVKLRGGASLWDLPDYDVWLASIRENETEKAYKKGLTKSSTYIAIRTEDEKVIGMIDIRHDLNEYLLKYGGHIGYSIRKSERRKGYGKEILRQGLNIAQMLGIKKVLLTCDFDNLASEKTIIANGGILEENPDAPRKRFWIDL